VITTNYWQRIVLVSLSVGVCVVMLLGTVVTNPAPSTFVDTPQEPISLAGEWQFYWGQLLSPADFAVASNAIPYGSKIAVPSSWVGQVLEQAVNAATLPYFGVATYRTQVVIPSRQVGTHTVLLLESIGAAYKVWVNGVLVGGLGQVARGSGLGDSYAETPQIQLNLIDIIPNTGQLDIIVQVSNYSFRESGIFGDVKIRRLSYNHDQCIQSLYRARFIADGGICGGWALSCHDLSAESP
jgi:hypothetical protein